MSENASVIVTRGSVVEAVHNISVAVVNHQGDLTHYVGNPDDFFMTRSSIKPFQLLPLILSGGADHFKFTSEQLAIMCGSHNGTDYHRDVVISNLKLAGNKPDMLQCGSHRPVWMEQENIFPKNDEEKDPLRHNCSGKHSGFLALSKYLDEDVEEYLNPLGKVQKMVKDTVSEFCEYDLDEDFYGTDGCSAPNFPLPLINLARSFMRLASGKTTSKFEKAVEVVREAMLSYPVLVSGEKRIDLALMNSLPNNLVCKIGAEALEGIGLREPAVGIAVKILDGNFRALEPVCIEVLRQLGIIENPEKCDGLKQFVQPEIRNVRNIITGKILVDFKLKSA